MEGLTDKVIIAAIEIINSFERSNHHKRTPWIQAVQRHMILSSTPASERKVFEAAVGITYSSSKVRTAMSSSKAFLTSKEREKVSLIDPCDNGDCDDDVLVKVRTKINVEQEFDLEDPQEIIDRIIPEVLTDEEYVERIDGNPLMVKNANQLVLLFSDSTGKADLTSTRLKKFAKLTLGTKYYNKVQRMSKESPLSIAEVLFILMSENNLLEE